MVEQYPIAGLKLYTAEWRQGSKGWRLNDPWAYRYFELCQELGITNIHVHKGPTVYPLSRDAFDVHDVDYAATDFPALNFIVEHVGLPRLEDFCWIATQEKHVYAGLAVAMPFIHPRPRYFAEIMANLLFWLGPDKILFGSDYAIWTPKWQIEKLMAFEPNPATTSFTPVRHSPDGIFARQNCLLRGALQGAKCSHVLHRVVV